LTQMNFSDELICCNFGNGWFYFYAEPLLEMGDNIKVDFK